MKKFVEGFVGGIIAEVLDMGRTWWIVLTGCIVSILFGAALNCAYSSGYNAGRELVLVPTAAIQPVGDDQSLVESCRTPRTVEVQGLVFRLPSCSWTVEEVSLDHLRVLHEYKEDVDQADLYILPDIENEGTDVEVELHLDLPEGFGPMMAVLSTATLPTGEQPLDNE